MLFDLNQHDIPAVITHIKKQITKESDPKRIRKYRTMIGMAEDAYKLKNLEDIMDYDTELMYDKKPIYDSEAGIIYKNGSIFTTDYTEDESEILIRNVEGGILEKFSYKLEEK